MKKNIKLKILIVCILILTAISLGIFALLNSKLAGNDVPISFATQINSQVDEPLGDFSCQPNECEAKITTGVNGIAYPSCNPKVQINNTGAKNPLACDYWRNQQKYFGDQEIVDLSELSKKRKKDNKEVIVDGFLGMDVYIAINKNAAPVFLKAEEEFNKKYGASRKASTYYLPSYPNGFKFEFSGSLNKRAVSGSAENTDGLLYEGKYITPSNHFWGVAIDFNATTNQGNRLGANQCIINIPPEFVKTFEENGLRWGGRFFTDNHTYFDPMHFELVPDCVYPGLLKM